MMQDSPDQFAVDVRKWVEKANSRADLAFQATAMLALGRVKELTPVDTGFLRASWQVVRAGQAATTGGEAANIELIASLRAGDNIALVNAAPYAMRINFGFVGKDKLGRKYDQKGRHMVEQTIAEMPQLAQAATLWVMGGGTPMSIPGGG